MLDPSFRGNEVEALAAGLPCAIEWHAGFRVHADVLIAHCDYRGADVARLGRAPARGGVLAMLGEAARSGAHDPQALKRVWHCPHASGTPERLLTGHNPTDRRELGRRPHLIVDAQGIPVAAVQLGD